MVSCTRVPRAGGCPRRMTSILCRSTSSREIPRPQINEDDNTASLDVAMSVAPYFELDDARVRADAGAVARAVATWRDEATRHGLTKEECARMASAFAHD